MSIDMLWIMLLSDFCCRSEGIIALRKVLLRLDVSREFALLGALELHRAFVDCLIVEVSE